MQKYHKRLIEPLIIKYLDNFSVVGITDPRQSGKSTVLKHLLKNSYTYVTFDGTRSRNKAISYIKGKIFTMEGQLKP